MSRIFIYEKVSLENTFTELCAVLSMASVGIKRVIWLTTKYDHPYKCKLLSVCWSAPLNTFILQLLHL